MLWVTAGAEWAANRVSFLFGQVLTPLANILLPENHLAVSGPDFSEQLRRQQPTIAIASSMSRAACSSLILRGIATDASPLIIFWITRGRVTARPFSPAPCARISEPGFVRTQTLLVHCRFTPSEEFLTI